MFADELLLHLTEKWFSRQCDECDANEEDLKSPESPGNAECLAVG
jgi:hypothetical protein